MSERKTIVGFLPRNIEDLWVFTTEGHPLLEFVRKKSIDPGLLGGLMSAVKSFCNLTTGENLQVLDLGAKKYLFSYCMSDRIILLLGFSSNVRDKQVKKVLKIIIKIFEDMYSPEDLENWDNDLAFFDKFRTKLKMYFKLSQV